MLLRVAVVYFFNHRAHRGHSEAQRNQIYTQLDCYTRVVIIKKKNIILAAA